MSKCPNFLACSGIGNSCGKTKGIKHIKLENCPLELSKLDKIKELEGLLKFLFLFKFIFPNFYL